MVNFLGKQGWYLTACAYLWGALIGLQKAHAERPELPEKSSAETLTIVPVSKYPSTDRKSFTEWIRTPKAVIVPEIAQLAVQAAIERSREYLDRFAYEQIVKGLLRGLSDAYPVETFKNPNATLAMRSLARLSTFLNQLVVDAKVGSLREMQAHCKDTFEKLDATSKTQLSFVFGGMLRIAEREVVKDPHALFWTQLQESACSAHGYVAESSRPEVWKFWTAYAVLSSVMPSEADSEKFTKALVGQKRVVDNAAKLDTYLSFKGKRSGFSLKTAHDSPNSPPATREIGKFARTSATSLLADYSSAWEEQVLSHLSVDTNAFSFEPIFDFLPNTYASTSAFEIGLVFWERRLTDRRQAPYGGPLRDFGRILTIDWLAAALDGFSSLASWTDALGFDSPADFDCTQNVYGALSAYSDLSYQVESALKSFEPTIDVEDPVWGRIQKAWLEGFRRFKTEALKIKSGYVKTDMPKEVSKWWNRIELGSSIGTIGKFSTDRGPVVVQLGRSSTGWVTPVELDKKKLTLWYPAAYVILNHNGKGLTTQEWKKLIKERRL